MSVDGKIKESTPFGTNDDFRNFCVDFIIGCLEQAPVDEPTTRKLIDNDIKRLIVDEGGITPSFAASFGKYLATVIKNDGKMSNGKFLEPYPDKPVYEQIIAKELSSVIMAMFPGSDPEVVMTDVRTFVSAEGIGDYHTGLANYIMSNIRSLGEGVGNLTFQELTEVLSILPGRAPKELEVRLYRNDKGDLKLQFVGEIDVRTTAGKRPE